MGYISTTTPNSIDRNANSPTRLRRTMQRLSQGAATSTIKVADPISNTGTIGLTLASNPGLQVISHGLSLKLADSSLSLAAGGVALNLATNSGLQVSSGVLLKLADNSLQLAAGGVSVKLNAAGAITTGATGLIVGVDGTSITIVGNQLKAASGAGSPLTTKGDLYAFSTVNARLPIGSNGQILISDSGQTTGLHWITANADTSLSAGVSGLAVALAANSGLAVSSGLKVQVATTSLTTNGSGLFVQLDPAGAISLGSGSGLVVQTGNGLTITANAISLNIGNGLAISAGKVVLLPADSSLTTSVSGTAVALATNSGLQISSGVLLKLTDTSLVLASTGVAVNPATSGGLAVSSGLLAKGLRLVAGTPASPVQGDTWFDTTAVQPRIQLGTGLTGNAVYNMASWPLAVSVLANTAAQTFATDQLALPAGFLNLVGRTLRIRMHLRMDASALANGFTFNVQLDGVIIATWGVNVGLGTAIDSAVDLLVTTRTTGASGTLFTSLLSQSSLPVVAAGLPTLDLTIARTLKFTCSATSTNAGDSTSILAATVDLVN